MHDEADRERETLLAAMEELGIDVSGMCDVEGDEWPRRSVRSEPGALTRALWRVRTWLWRWTRPVIEPRVRRRMIRRMRNGLRGVTELEHSCDSWEWRERNHSLELHTWVARSEVRGPSCDLALVAQGRRGYRRVARAWERGRIAPSRRAWFLWLVPGDRWDAQLAQDAKRRWLRAVMGRDDIKLVD
jgi:hypothetical protein